MKHIFLITFLLLALATGSYAQQDTAAKKYSLSVAECVSYAYQHQHDVVNANLDVTSAEYHVKEIIGQGYPQLSGAASFIDYLKIPVTLIPGEFFGQPGTFVPLKFGVTYQSSAGLTLNQLIFDPSYIVGLQGRKTYKQLYERSYTRSKIEANVSVTKAYYQVLVSAEQLKLLDANLKELKQQLDETGARNKQGFVEKIDVDRATVQYNSLKTTRENTVRLLALNYQLLKFQMGMPIDNELVLTDNLENIKLDASAADPQNDTSVYHNRIEYNLLETQKQLDLYDIKLKKGSFLPKLTGVANYSASFQNNSFGQLYSNNFPSAYVGLNLSLPIFTGWQHKNQLKQSQINLFKVQNDMDEEKKYINLQISEARTSYINGLQTLNDQRNTMSLANEVLRVAKIKYEQGVGSSIEVTQAETDVTQADNTYIQGLYDALVSKVDLDQAYGRIQ